MRHEDQVVTSSCLHVFVMSSHLHVFMLSDRAACLHVVRQEAACLHVFYVVGPSSGRAVCRHVVGRSRNPQSMHCHSCYIAGFIVVTLSATQVLDDHVQGILGTNHKSVVLELFSFCPFLLHLC
jgi:hypothetical protein